MLSGDGNKNSRKKKSVGLISKNTTLHVQHTFYVHFFAVVLHDKNVVCVPVHFFFSLPLIFTLLAASISHFLTAAIKLSCSSSNKIDFFCFLSLSVFHVNVDIKTESIRKLSDFNFQWTKTLYQNNLNNIASLFTFFKDYRYNLLSVIDHSRNTITYHDALCLSPQNFA